MSIINQVFRKQTATTSEKGVETGKGWTILSAFDKFAVNIEYREC